MSRIFSSADYGILGLYMSISGLIGVIAYIHYPQGIMLAKCDDEARQLMWLSIVFSLLVALVSFIVILLVYVYASKLFAETLRFWIFLIPVSVFLSGVSNTIMVWANRHQLYKILASNRIIQAVFTVTVQISFGLLVKDETGLMLGLIGGQFISSFLLIIRFKKNDIAPINKPRIQTFKTVAYKYRSLLFFSTPSGFINNLINQLPIFLLQKFGGLAYVGSYNFTQRLLGMPQLFLSSAIVEVFKQKASVAYNSTGNCRAIFIKTLKALFILSLIPFTVIIVLGPSLFTFIFGNQWQLAGEFAQFLGILFFFRFIVSPLTYVYTIAGKLKEDFYLHILFLLVTTLSFYIGDKLVEDKRFLILIYSIGYVGVYIIYFFRSYYFSKGTKFER